MLIAFSSLSVIISSHTIIAIDTMVEPVSVLSLVFSSMQFVLQLKSYLLERRRRKRQEQLEHQLQQQQLPPPYYHYPHVFLPTPITTYYCICAHNVFPAQYPAYIYHQAQFMHPAPNSYPPPPLPPTSLHFPYHNRPSSRSVDANPSFTNYDAPVRPSYDWLGLLDGYMELHNHQQAPVISGYAHGTLVGMCTGACAYNDRVASYNHWKSLQEESTQGIQSSIAVVDWSRGNIDMFMEIGGAYFRNYRISRCDVAIFAHLFKRREVFSGEIKEQKLKRFSKEMKMVEMRGTGVQSTNSWCSLGITDDSVDFEEVLSEHGSFIRMVRGAVFGLVCCLYEAPSDLNVDMEAAPVSGHLDIVRVNTRRPPSCIAKRDSCVFSVFSFSDRGWAAQDILLG